MKRPGKVVYLLSFIPNPRFNKRINAAKQLFDVALICWDKSDAVSFRNVHKDVRSSIVTIPADSFNPLKRITPYKRFCTQALSALKEEAPNVIHLQGLDMLMIACWYKKHFANDVRIIYEVADLHPLTLGERESLGSSLLSKGLISLEKRCSKSVDMLVVTSKRYFDAFYRRFYQLEQVLFIPNAPAKAPFLAYSPKDHSRDFTVGFIGAVRFPEQLMLLVTAAHVAGANVLFAGMSGGSGADEVRRIAEAETHVEYFGRYDYDSQIAQLYERCDVVYSVYPTSELAIRVALPNKLYESILCELPIIVSKDTYVGELVESWGVGLTVRCDSEGELVDALKALMEDKDLYAQMQQACFEMRGMADIEGYIQEYVSALKGMLC